MYCDWSAQLQSYISIYNALPAHDWTVNVLTQYNNPANQIMVGEHRNDLISSDYHKGASGFYPSQPCPQWAQVPYLPGANQYSQIPQSIALSEYAAALAAGFGSSGTIFKKWDVVRTGCLGSPLGRSRR